MNEKEQHLRNLRDFVTRAYPSSKERDIALTKLREFEMWLDHAETWASRIDLPPLPGPPTQIFDPERFINTVKAYSNSVVYLDHGQYTMRIEYPDTIGPTVILGPDPMKLSVQERQALDDTMRSLGKL